MSVSGSGILVSAGSQRRRGERGKRKRSRERVSLPIRVVWRLSAFVCILSALSAGSRGVRDESTRIEACT